MPPNANRPGFPGGTSSQEISTPGNPDRFSRPTLGFVDQFLVREPLHCSVGHTCLSVSGSAPMRSRRSAKQVLMAGLLGLTVGGCSSSGGGASHTGGSASLSGSSGGAVASGGFGGGGGSGGSFSTGGSSSGGTSGEGGRGGSASTGGTTGEGGTLAAGGSMDGGGQAAGGGRAGGGTAGGRQTGGGPGSGGQSGSGTDNRFLQQVGRFPTIEEDEPPLYLLVGDYGQYFGGKG